MMFAAALLAGEAIAAADPAEVLQLTLSAALLKDNNLYRLPDVDPRIFGVDPDKKSDVVEQLGVRLRVDKQVSRQRFIVDGTADQNNYRKNDKLDHVSGEATARWLWEVGNPWNGEVSYSYRRYLSGFADTAANVVNLVSVNTYSFEGGYRPHPRWRLWAGASELDTSNSALSQTRVNIDISTALFGVDYRTPSGNSAGVQLRLAEGTHPDRVLLPGQLITNDYKDTEGSVVLDWQTGAKTHFHGRLGYLERRHREIPARDFSGLTGRAHFTWEISGKSQLRVAGWRELRTFESQTSSYVLASGVELVPTWAVTAKLSLQGTASYETRDYQGDPGIVLGILPPRTDDVRVLRLAVVYTPIRYVETSLVLEKSSRDSNRPSNNFDDETAFFSLKLSF
jgi:exopolysaccharide biosynthesis operon protein EpsL